MSPWRRLPAAVTLLLHLMVVGVGPAVDARLELAAELSEHAPAHVEDAADPACGSAHHHAFCLVRALQSMDVPPGGALLRITLAPSPGRPLPVSSAVRNAAALPALGPRAPPAA